MISSNADQASAEYRTSPDGRSFRRDSAGHAAAADAARARARVPAPGRRRVDVVDTGVGTARREGARGARSSRAQAAVSPRVFVTHFHPDHVGAAADLHELTGAPVYQGALDYAQCELVWGNPAWSERLLDWFRLHGTPDDVTEELVGQSSRLPAVHPLPARSDPRRGGGAASTAGSSSPRRATPTASSACSRTASSIAADHLLAAGSRPRSGSGRRAAPTRSATTSRRSSGRSSSRRASRCPATASRSRIPAGRARELQEHHRAAARGDGRGARRRSRGRATSSRSRSSATT